MYDGTVERCIPVKIVGTKRTNRTDGTNGGILEDSGKARNSPFSDGLKYDCSLVEPCLRASAIVTIRNLDTESGFLIEASVGNFFAGE